MEVKKITEGMTAPQVAQVIDDNFKGLNEEKANKIETDAKFSELDKKSNTLVHNDYAIVLEGNLLKSVQYTEGYYIHNNSLLYHSTFSVTDYIGVSKGQILLCNSIADNGGCLYDVDKNYISDFGKYHGLYNNSIVIPDNVAFIRLNVSKKDREKGVEYLSLLGSKDNLVLYPWQYSIDKRCNYKGFETAINTIINAKGETEYFKNFNLYSFNVKEYAGKKLLFFLDGLAEPNGDWALFSVERINGNKDTIVNTYGIYTTYAYNVPSDALRIEVSSLTGNILIMPMSFPYEVIRPENYKDVNDIPLSAKFKGPRFDILGNNLLNGVKFTYGKFINLEGETIVFETFCHSDFIDISGKKRLIVSNMVESAGCFYDKDKKFIKGFGVSPTKRNQILLVPINASYIILNVSKKELTQGFSYLVDYDADGYSLHEPDLYNKVLANSVEERKGWLDEEGGIQIFSSGYYNVYKIMGAKWVSISNETTISEGSIWSAFWFVSAAGERISSVPIDATTPKYYGYKVEVPEGAEEIWVSSGAPKVHLYGAVVEKEDEELSNNQWKGKKIVWLGTSIPWGQTSETGVSNPMPNPYPKIVGEKLKSTIVNVARPGMAIETTDDFKRKSFGSLSLTIAELQAEGASTTPYQSFENALLGHDAELYVFDCEPNNSNADTSIIDEFDFQLWKYKDNSTFESHRNSYIGAMLFLLNKLWEEKPSAKVVFVSEFGSYKSNNWGQTYNIRTATYALAQKLNIHVINLHDKLYYNKKNITLYLNSDMVHPTVLAHKRMANMLANELLLID